MNEHLKSQQEPVEILIVEDSPTQAEELKYLLEKHEFRVTAAGNGRQALELLKNYKPQLVITDIIMPEMDGYELCRQIKANVSTEYIPVILLTSLSDSTDVLEGLACGADNFITKPYSESYLLPSIEQMLANRKLVSSERVRVGVEIQFAEKRRFITADQQQMLTLLISTYEAAVNRNNELIQAQNELKLLNEQLEDRVAERTKALSESEDRFREIFIRSTVGKSLASPDGIMLVTNKAFADMLGYAVEDLRERDFLQFTHPDDAPESREYFRSLLSNERESYRIEKRYIHKDGGIVWADESSTLIRDENGATLYIITSVVNITERKQFESRERLAREALEHMNRPQETKSMLEGILRVIKKNTDFEAIGIRMREGDDFPYYGTLGFPEDFVVAERSLCAYGKDGKIIRDGQGNPELDCMCGNILCGRTDTSLPFFTEGGSFWSNCTTELLVKTTEADRQARTRNRCNGEGYESVALIPLRSGDEIVGLLQLNDRRANRFTREMILFFEGFGASVGIALAHKRAEEELLESKALFEAVVEHVPHMIFLKEAEELRFVIFNRAGEELLGYGRKDLLGKNNLDLFPPEQAAHFMAKDREVLDGEAEMLDIPEEPILTAGKGQRLLHTRKVCIRGADGVSKFLLGISEDITDRKKAEEDLRKSEEQLRQSQKMEAVGRLAGGIAHDFNNMLSVINGYAGMAIDALRPGDPLLEDMKEILKAGERSADLTRQLLAFSRRQALVPEILDINDTIAGIEQMLRRLIGEDIDFIACLAGDLGKVKADPGQIEQVVLNLAVNARDAMPMGGKLTIETANVELDGAYAEEHPEVAPGQYVALSVSDTGCGMDKATKENIFEPFFTTKEKGKGTGLGLSTVYGIVNQSGGHIWVYSEPGEGTTFKIYLRRELSIAETAVREKRKFTTTTGTETILVVEDEPGVLSLTKRALEASGYKVHTAANGGEALLICEREGDSIHLIITDMVMPEMSGSELAERLAKICPHIKALYMSGYTENAIVHNGILDQNIHFISKPFSLQDLTAKVREALDG
ncbi:MAG: response regulator [bacterium]